MYKKNCKGFTVLELIIAVSITIAILAIVVHFVFNNWKQHSFLVTKGHIKNMSQMAINRLSRHISTSKRLFDNTSSGNSYRNQLDLTNSPTPINTTTLSTINPNGSFSPSKLNDPNNPFEPNKVGNALLFAELLQPFNNIPSNVPDKRALDIYQFSFYYISKSNRDIYINNSYIKALDLIEWYSIPYVDYYQLNAYLTDIQNNSSYTSTQKSTYRASINTALINSNIKVAWDRSSNLATSAFYNINTDGTLSATGSNYKIKVKNFGNLLRLTKDENIYSIAYNNSNTFPIDIPVPLFAIPNNSGDMFPNGFEVMIIGPNSGRAVHTRITVVGQTNFRQIIPYSISTTTYARDL